MISVVDSIFSKCGFMT